MPAGRDCRPFSKLTAANAQLSAQIAALNRQVTTLQGQLQACAAQILLLEQNFRTTFDNPTFTIAGATSGAQLQKLVSAILGLNYGQEKAV